MDTCDHTRITRVGKRRHWMMLALLLMTSTAFADEWSDYIRSLESADARTKKERLPKAYHDYAYELFADRPKDAFRYMEKSLALQNNQTYRNDYAELLYRQAVSMVNDRKDNDHQDREARRYAEKSLKYNRRLGKAHELIGDVAYDNQDLNSARLSWTCAKQIKSSSRLEKKLAKLVQERAVEKSFHRESHSFFDIRYQSSIKANATTDLRKYLDHARDTVGRDLRYLPRHKLVVLVYSQHGFDRIVRGRGPGWWAAFYDGKIRVPVSNEVRKIQPTIVHEYTHAVVHDLSRGRCPKWLNEGLAEYQEAKIRTPQLNHLRHAYRSRSLIPFAELNETIAGSSHAAGLLAYEQSYSIVKLLAEKYGFRKVRAVIDRLGEGRSIDDAMKSELGVDRFQLERQWEAWLPEQLR